MMKQFLDNSYLFGGNAPFVEELYEKYLANPAEVPEEWRSYFESCSLFRARRRKISRTRRLLRPLQFRQKKDLARSRRAPALTASRSR